MAESRQIIRERFQDQTNEELKRISTSLSFSTDERSVAAELYEARTEPRDHPIHAPSVMGIVGVLTLIVGLYYLVIAPGAGGTVNLQRLTIGEALTIAGAIFAASAWRPR